MALDDVKNTKNKIMREVRESDFEELQLFYGMLFTRDSMNSPHCLTD